MTSRPSPRALTAAALLAVTLSAGCSAGTDAAAPSSAPLSAAPASSAPSAAPTAAPTTAATTAPTTPPTTPPPPAAPAVRQLTLTVAGGTVSGDTGTVPVELGEPVRLTVTSDVADEVHVHGADVSADVTAGGTVTLEFVQEAPGRFEVELEKSRRLLTRLQVS